MEKTDCRELLEAYRNVIDVESTAFLMILLAPEVSFVTLHMRWHKGCFPKASTKNRLSTDPVKDVNQRVWFLIFPTTIVLLGKTLNSLAFPVNCITGTL